MMFYCTARGAYPIPANILKRFTAATGSSGSTATQQQFTECRLHQNFWLPLN